MRFIAVSFVLWIALMSAAAASSSQWFETEGARIRLVTAGQPDAQGFFTGALEVALEPGWKTYWRDPGEAGVPPSIDVSASPLLESAVMGFPPPERIDDGSTTWAGYKHPVAFPITFKARPGAAPIVTADIFLGVCEAICVPVQARLEFDPAADPNDADDLVVVKAALDALPAPARPDFAVTALDSTVPSGSDEMVLEATFPGEDAELFLATPAGFVFGTPVRREVEGRTYFTVAIIDRAGPETGYVPYTLVTSAGAVEGELPPWYCCKPTP